MTVVGQPMVVGHLSRSGQLDNGDPLPPKPQKPGEVPEDFTDPRPAVRVKLSSAKKKAKAARAKADKIKAYNDFLGDAAGDGSLSKGDLSELEATDLEGQLADAEKELADVSAAYASRVEKAKSNLAEYKAALSEWVAEVKKLEAGAKGKGGDSAGAGASSGF